MTDRVYQTDGSRRPTTRRIQSWHAPKPNDRAPAAFGADARMRRLARLVPLWPKEIAATEPDAAQRVVAALERALRGERRRGRSGHWSYDVNRHLALSRALHDEQVRLAALQKASETGATPHSRRLGPATETKSLRSNAV